MGGLNPACLSPPLSSFLPFALLGPPQGHPMPGDLVTTAEVANAWGGFSALPVDEQAALITSVSRAVEKSLGYAVTTGTYTETVRPENTRIVRLAKASPVLSIMSIVYGKTGSTTPITNYSIVGDGSSGEIEVYQSFVVGFRYPDRLYSGDPRYGDVTVIYTAGYDTVDVPGDLKRAAILAIKSVTDSVKVGAFRSESIGAYSYAIANPAASAIPDSAMALLKPWRRRRFV
jgi:hypothetical protein